MTLDQAIATLREFRMLRLGPELSEAIDVVVSELEHKPFRSAVPAAPTLWDGTLMYFGGREIPGWSHSEKMVRAFGFDPGPL